MTVPENITALIDGYEQRGEQVPERFQSPPVSPDARPYLTAFWALSHDRPIGFGGVGGISFVAVDAYAKRIGIVCEEEFWTFERMIRACDAIWLRHANASGKDKRTTISSTPMTPERFDAMFG